MYQVLLSNQATKALKKLPIETIKGIVQKIEDLKSEPRPNNCKKLKGREGYRIRIGNYRVIYTINDNQLIIQIIAIGHRKNIYYK